MYAIQFVTENDLPPNREWLLLRAGNRVTLFLKETAICPRVLEEAWAGYRKLEPRSGAVEQERPGKVLALHG